MFDKEVEYIKGQLGNEKWVTVYGCFKHEDSDKKQRINFYCGLISNEKREKTISNAGWEIIPDYLTQFITSIEDFDRYINLYEFEKAEPLVFIRYYYGFREEEIEISEEFRFFHNLYYDKKKNEYHN